MFVHVVTCNVFFSLVVPLFLFEPVSTYTAIQNCTNRGQVLTFDGARSIVLVSRGKLAKTTIFYFVVFGYFENVWCQFRYRSSIEFLYEKYHEGV